MFLGYNTNGFAHHRLEDALAILAGLGYTGVALTLDVHHLDPLAPDLTGRTAAARKLLDEYKLKPVIETGARFLLDPVRKHQPTLIGPTPEERSARFEFLKLCVEMAGELGAEVVSFWSGTATDDAPPDVLMTRLADGCKALADLAAAKNVRLAFEPEPGMLVDTMDRYAELFYAVGHPAFGLTADVGHLVCQGELPVSAHLHAWRSVLWNVHVEDMRPGLHEHLMFGQGEVDFFDVFAGLTEAGFNGVASVELSRYSHDAVSTARKAKAFLDKFVQ
jgi:L-ribulose-5-phosphate 3-epimerase